MCKVRNLSASQQPDNERFRNRAHCFDSVSLSSSNTFNLCSRNMVEIRSKARLFNVCPACSRPIPSQLHAYFASLCRSDGLVC